MPRVTVNKYVVNYTVTGINVTADSSVAQYPTPDDVRPIMTGLRKPGDWTLGFEVTPKRGKTETTVRVNGFGYPIVDKHPGHVEGKGWKYNVDEGTGSVDRLVVSGTSCTMQDPEIDDDAKTITVKVAIELRAKVLLNTH